MPERTIPAPLSGLEVKAAILDRISAQLDRDCFLHPNASYDFFSGTWKGEIILHDAGRDDVMKIEGAVTYGPDPTELPAPVTSEVDFQKEPPNQTRVETGQPVPTDTGKKIRYARKTANVRAS
jgi:hypothetical protein